MGIDVLIIRHQDEVLKDLAIQFPNIKFINAERELPVIQHKRLPTI